MKSLIKKRVGMKSIILASISFLVMALLVLQLPVSAANTFPHQYELVTVNSIDGKGVDRDASVRGVSLDGNRILFTSTATNLPLATPSIQENGGFMRDMNTATTTRIDLSSSGVVPDKQTTGHVMSTTGRYVAFSSTASNIIDGVSKDNSVSRVYLKDLQTSAVELLTDVSGVTIWTPNGTYAGSFGAVAVSDDGRYVVVTTNTINSLLPGTRSGGGMYSDYVLYDRMKSTWTLINKPIDNAMQGQSAGYAQMNCDGSFIVFTSAATNLASVYSGSGKHVYLADIRNGLHITDITPGTIGDSIPSSISCNGRYITYSTKDRTLIDPTPVGMNTYAHLVRYDRLTGERKYIDSASNNTTFSGYYDAYQDGSLPSSVSDKGDVVLVYGSNADTYNRRVYFKHLSDESGTLEPVQSNYAGLVYNTSSATAKFSVSPDNKYVIVSSKDVWALGILEETGAGYGSLPYDILRIKTGL